ncbi:fructose-1,6-bisphosphatase [Saitoella complicata NRRL Y-17804]|uniref:fructose-1,6-bisphosphatase n=1 Tax=Saitoella complicata (strain BCRC 22490 / CBS 7301 / JCM 7358 / NBRC 10748 / NRRL Y-17804) TaxID=698492 RepID=UPI00086684B8|nr:fructose-1,6-bisphosphatase [Saitoella complicata NRRL Y-17804]ODQ53467.1 fructose-1,6-bisphosphatase [Saitoella complicata NRRL Y-17804]
MTEAKDLRADIPTLTRFILQEQQKFGQSASGDLTQLLNAVQLTCKFIAFNIRRAQLINLVGLAGASNATGDDQKKLDVLGNDIFVNQMKNCGKVAVIVSEEEEHPIIVEGPMKGKYCIACDPIDGSSNLDAGVSVGTIFGIYKIRDGSEGTVEDILNRNGLDMVCAGYCMYAASTNLVLTTGHGVNGFTLDNALGEFILTHPNMTIPDSKAIYSVNEGNAKYWDEPCTEYFNSIKFPSEGKPYSARYIGSMVADVHRTICYGGLFAYPNDTRGPGKLRILYECFPMAMVMEQAGGEAWSGEKRMLEVVPTNIHERCGIWLGSKKQMQEVKAVYAKYGGGNKAN